MRFGCFFVLFLSYLLAQEVVRSGAGRGEGGWYVLSQTLTTSPAA